MSFHNYIDFTNEYINNLNAFPWDIKIGETSLCLVNLPP